MPATVWRCAPHCKLVPLVKKDAAACDAPNSSPRCAAALDPMEDICALLSRAIDDEAPLSVREGGMIRDGYSEELDELRDISHNGKTYLAELELREREATGIKNLKIGYNRVFGYYIEVTRSFYDSGAVSLHAQADAGQLRAVHHGGTEGSGAQDTRRGGKRRAP